MKNYIVGGISGAVGGLVAGGIYAAVTDFYSIVVTSIVGLLIGTIAGMLLVVSERSEYQSTRFIRWIGWFLFLGLLSRIPVSLPYGLAALFGFAGISEYEPTNPFLFIACLINLLGGLAGACGGLIGGLLFNFWQQSKSAE